MKEGRKPEYPEKTLTTSFRKCHMLKARKFKRQARFEPALVAG